MKKIVMLAAAFSAFVASAEITITGVTARQRWPWNNLVDIDFVIGGAAEGEAYYIDVSGTYDNGNRSLFAKTFATEPIAATGKNRVVWNLGADYPEFKADDLVISVTATPFSDATPVYLVVDLSGGASAASWPVRYTTKAPVHTAGQNDPCKTTELWLKRVKAGTFTAGGGTHDTWYRSHTCTLTQDFYLGVFELTQAQVSLIKSGNFQITNTTYYKRNYSLFTNETYAATRPVDSFRLDEVRGSNYSSWPSTKTITDDCVCKRLRDRTGLAFDLPTEWQWEYACRAGTTGEQYPNAEYRCNANSQPPAEYEWYSEQQMWGEDYGTSYVDRYAPNPWGFYGMLGNVSEWCINTYQSGITAGSNWTDPTGSGNNAQRILRGGHWGQETPYCHTGAAFDNANYGNGQSARFYHGARICLTIANPEE